MIKKLFDFCCSSVSQYNLVLYKFTVQTLLLVIAMFAIFIALIDVLTVGALLIKCQKEKYYYAKMICFLNEHNQTRMTEAFEAAIALERLLASVQPLMLLQVMLVLERFATVFKRARVRTILRGGRV